MVKSIITDVSSTGNSAFIPGGTDGTPHVHASHLDVGYNGEVIVSDINFELRAGASYCTHRNQRLGQIDTSQDRRRLAILIERQAIGIWQNSR